jgi:hypothetical protein
MPAKATVDAHDAEVGHATLMPSTAAGVQLGVANVCLVPRVWAPCLIEGGGPKEVLDKIELLVAESPVEFRQAFAGIQAWARCSCVARGAGQLPSSISTPLLTMFNEGQGLGNLLITSH